MVPLMAPVLGIDPSAGYEPAPTEGRKLEEQVAQAVLDYVIACAEEQPAIVMAENVHWFDDATRELLAELMRSGPGRHARRRDLAQPGGRALGSRRASAVDVRRAAWS